jgi:CRP-like cAMP-binding protein
VIAEIPEGKCFGEMSFLLAAPRVAKAIALDDVELVTINSENINNLMNEFPGFVIEMLKEMAARLRAADKLID